MSRFCYTVSLAVMRSLYLPPIMFLNSLVHVWHSPPFGCTRGKARLPNGCPASFFYEAVREKLNIPKLVAHTSVCHLARQRSLWVVYSE